MDLNALREAAIEATARALYDKLGIVPSDDSDEWEEEYRRQFAALKQRLGTDLKTAAAAVRPATATIVDRNLPELSGTPEQKRWAATIRRPRRVSSFGHCAIRTSAWSSIFRRSRTARSVNT